MYIYTEDEFIMIPMAMNAFYYNIPFGAKKIKYANIVSIGEEFMEILIDYIDGIPEGKFIVIDMDCATYAFRLFEKFQEVRKPLIFINLNAPSIYEKVKDNLPELDFSEDKMNATLNIKFDKMVEETCKKYSLLISHNIYVQIVKSLIEDMSAKEFVPQKLDSSGLYSNMYVNAKHLFLNPQDYYVILYALAKKVANSGIEFDGFVSSSKNGAVLANLLGMMLDKKAIHIAGLGPKYNMYVGNLQKEIKKRKNYIYVFDFRCTGTEMKIVSALVNAHDAYMQGAIGIAVYKKDEEDIMKEDIMYLVDIKKEGIPYKIAGEKEDILQLRNS